MTVACNFKEVFGQAGLTAVADTVEVLVEPLSLVESLTCLDFAHRLTEILLETSLKDL